MDLSALLSNLSPDTIRLWQKPVPTTPPTQRPPSRALQRQVRLSDERLAQLVARHDAGYSVRQLATEFGINRETASGHLKRAGVAHRLTNRKLTDEQVAQAAALYATNLSLATIAKRFKVDSGTIRREFMLADFPIRPRRGWARKPDPTGHGAATNVCSDLL